MTANPISPRTLADALGISESSLRRWVDAGQLPSVKTPGGHRRIALADALNYIRTAHLPISRPELLGLEPHPTPTDPADALFHALRDGNRPQVRSLVLSWFLAGRPVPWIFDQPLKDAMARLGKLFRDDEANILVEHRATQIAMSAVEALRNSLPPRPPSAPVALGGAPSGDPYLLPSFAAATTLADAGFRAINFGPQTPLRLLAQAAQTHQARLVFVSVSVVADPPTFLADLDALAADLATQQRPLILGGRAIRDTVSPSRPMLHTLTSMAQLHAFALGLLAPPPLASQP